jgi:hypothetical protein
MASIPVLRDLIVTTSPEAFRKELRGDSLTAFKATLAR